MSILDVAEDVTSALHLRNGMGDWVQWVFKHFSMFKNIYVVY